LTRKGKSSATVQLKARILLHADTGELGSGWNDAQISEALETYPVMCLRVRRTYATQGLDAVLNRKKRATPPTPPIFDGEKTRWPVPSLPKAARGGRCDYWRTSWSNSTSLPATTRSGAF